MKLLFEHERTYLEPRSKKVLKVSLQKNSYRITVGCNERDIFVYETLGWRSLTAAEEVKNESSKRCLVSPNISREENKYFVTWH